MFSNTVTQFLEVIQLISLGLISQFMLLNWAIPEKIQTGVLRAYFFEKTPGIVRFVTLPWEIPDKMKFRNWKFHQIISHPSEFPRPKTKTHGNSTLFFSWSCLKIPLLFLLTPGVSRFYFFQSPLSPTVCFFWNSPWGSNSFTASQEKNCKRLIQQNTRFAHELNHIA